MFTTTGGSWLEMGKMSLGKKKNLAEVQENKWKQSKAKQSLAELRSFLLSSFKSVLLKLIRKTWFIRL